MEERNLCRWRSEATPLWRDLWWVNRVVIWSKRSKI